MSYKTIRANYVNVEATAGANISDAVEESIRLAGDLGALVSLRFNGKTIICEPWDNPSQRVREYMEG